MFKFIDIWTLIFLCALFKYKRIRQSVISLSDECKLKLLKLVVVVVVVISVKVVIKY